MMKHIDTMKEIEIDAVNAVRELLGNLPAMVITSVDYEEFASVDRGIDGKISFRYGDVDYALIIEVKAKGAPRHVRGAIYQLRNYVAYADQNDLAHVNRKLIPMLVVPYLSPESRTVCIDHNVAYLDLFGNSHLAFDAVYIDRAVADKPKAEVRALRSIFTPKASAILRAIVSEPQKAWRVTELAEKADASLGHVSNVRKALLEREWIEESEDGVVLSKPSELLDAWRDNYRRPSRQRVSRYTPLHGQELEERLRGTLNPYKNGPLAVYSQNSAAKWIAPFGRNSMNTFYADDEGSEMLEHALSLSHAPKGANVVIHTTNDNSIFRDAIEPVSGIFCTSPVQTYLDLWNGNDRDREAATVLREEALSWSR